MKESIPQKTEISESQAEEKLDELLSDPDNRFLNEIPENKKVLDDAETAKDALAFAERKIHERLEASTYFHRIATIEGWEMNEFNLKGLRNTVESILQNALQIGVGGDAIVVIDRNEIRSMPPEICYKFAIAETTKRGRNSIVEEADLHGEFYELAQEAQTKIGIPKPFYSLEIGEKKLIAMEKLPAKSIDDILRGKGDVPEWFDIDEFSEELRKLLDYLHEHHLYHRDMHMGNIMITQKKELEAGDPVAYIIDFGLSGKSEIEEFAYRKERAGDTFTYADDYGIINEAARVLENHISRVNRGI